MSSTFVDAPQARVAYPCAAAKEQRSLHVLVVASEIFPLAKTGGLADVASALPKSLTGLGIEARLIMPAYPSALEQALGLHVVAELGEVLGAPVRVWCGRMSDSNLPVWLVDSPELYRRSGSLYVDEQGQEWSDNARRFAVLSHVAANIALGRTAIAWRPDVVHCNDWHTGLVPLLLHHAPQPRPRCVFTIHNAAFQGNFPLDVARQFDLPLHTLATGGAEFYGQFSFLKAGIRYADKITTVSPTYAREICTSEFGFGLDGLLRSRASDLVGILNGIDDDLWNPAADPHLAQAYARADCGGKAACKCDLQHRLGLRVDADAPLAVFVSRVTPQKMADVLLDRLPHVMQRAPHMQFALLGRGDRHLEEGFSQLAAAFPGRASARIEYTEPKAHRMHAGGDILLHGSRFEPCGLAQLYAMRYGTIPVVRRVGGLADSVADAECNKATPTGFVFDDATGNALSSAIDRSLHVYQARRGSWQRLQANAMSADFSWRRSAREYATLFAHKLTGMAADLRNGTDDRWPDISFSAIPAAFSA